MFYFLLNAHCPAKQEKPRDTQNVSEFSIEPGNTVASARENPPSIQSIDNQLQLSPVSLSLLDASHHVLGASRHSARRVKRPLIVFPLPFDGPPSKMDANEFSASGGTC